MKTTFKIFHEMTCRGMNVLSVNQYNALKEIYFLGFSSKAEAISCDSKNMSGIWKIKQLKN